MLTLDGTAVLGTSAAVRLAHLEQIIEAGQQTFIEVGNALLEIHETQLYRQSHKTFDAYCKERWRFTGRRARQFMAGAEVIKEIGTRVPLSTAVRTEAQARVLAGVIRRKGPEAAAKVWIDAVETGETSAADLRREVDPTPATTKSCLVLIDSRNQYLIDAATGDTLHPTVAAALLDKTPERIAKEIGSLRTKRAFDRLSQKVRDTILLAHNQQVLDIIQACHDGSLVEACQARLDAMAAS